MEREEEAAVKTKVRAARGRRRISGALNSRTHLFSENLCERGLEVGLQEAVTRIGKF